MRHPGGFKILNKWSVTLASHVPKRFSPKDKRCVKLIKARGLGTMDLKEVIIEGYPTYSPSGPMRLNPHPSENAPKKVKLLKVAEE
ncbi:hypothetical protein JCGZ_10554 [Jatropha curcas]|uniref:Uncharacterized protein n=1 Tax=Jatropha curcas TaxID=180498 RepID=A0A067KSI1_JATCU|nr:hypothetical protein JCGZ_10554 [Jatropha curcas]